MRAPTFSRQMPASPQLFARYERLAQTLSDEQLASELRCVERCALLTTRSLRHVALIRCRCLARELERRQMAREGENRG